MPRPLVSAALLALTLLLASTPSPAAAGEHDWTFWRGPSMDGHSRAKNLPDDWDPKGGEGSNVVWKRTDLGTRSSPVVFDGRLYFLARHNPDEPTEQEKVVCLDAATGETVWEYVFKVFLSDVPDSRVAWSNVTVDPETGRVYALGVCDLFSCLDGSTGEVIWQESMSERYGMLNTYGGRTNFPIVVDDTVVISGIVIGYGEQAKPAHRFFGFDKSDGTVRWVNQTRLLPYDTTYSSPILTTLNGAKTLVFGSGDGGVHALQPLTGKILWKYNISGRGINTTPLVDHATGRVFCGHPEENNDTTKMGALFSLDGTATGDLTGKPIWRENELFVGRSTPLLIGNRLYATDDRAKMHVLDASTGEELDDQRMGTMMRMSPIYADGKIYAVENNGRWFILRPDGDKLDVVSKGRLPRGEGCDGSPAVSNGRIYLPTSGAMYCIGKPDAEVVLTPEANNPIPEPTPVGDDDAPAQLQVVPAEAVINPGETVAFTVRLYNDRGQYLRDAASDELEWSLDNESHGALSGDGQFEAAADSGVVVTRVTAKLSRGEVSGMSRVRTVPDLNWSFDFDDGVIPEPWVGARYRMVCLDGDLLDELQASDPTAADLYIFIGSTFINSGAPKLTFDDSSPALKWTALLRFFGLDEAGKRPADLAASKAAFDAALTALADAAAIGGFEWSTWTRGDSGAEQPRLSVTKGSRGVKGNGVLCKIRTIPKGTRSQSWMARPDIAGNYTIQADVKGYARDGKLPDIGVIGQRYTLDMMGASQQVQIRTWTPQLYMAQTVPFQWEPNRWYTTKLRTEVAEDGKTAVLRGKVWPRDEAEPAEWTVVAEDSLPNTQGSPGLFGNAKDSEIFYDNISVTKNDAND